MRYFATVRKYACIVFYLVAILQFTLYTNYHRHDVTISKDISQTPWDRQPEVPCEGDIVWFDGGICFTGSSSSVPLAATEGACVSLVLLSSNVLVPFTVVTFVRGSGVIVGF